MGRGIERSRRRPHNGGIISLADFVLEHRKAIEYDLLTRTGFQINDVGGALSWCALDSFIRNLDTDSALARDFGKSTGWENTIQTNTILADLYDLLQVINANLISLGGDKPKKIKPYPRPNGEKNIKKIGKGALPYEELKKWIKERQKHG